MSIVAVRAVFLLLLGVGLISVAEANAQNPFFPKPDLVVNHIKAPLEAVAGEALGGRVELTIYNQGTAPVEGGYRIDFFFSSDRKLQSGIQPGPTTRFVDDVILEGGQALNLPALGIEQTYGFTQQRLTLMDEIPIGTYYICAYIDPNDIVEEEGSRSNFLCAPIHIIAGENSPAPPAEEPSRPEPVPAPVNNPNELEDYDADGNCSLNDAEFFNLVDDWTADDIPGSLFFAAIDAWMSQRSICSAASQTREQHVAVQHQRDGILFSSASREPLDVVVYDALGQVLFAEQSLSGMLYWNLRTLSGERVANGVYFVQFSNAPSIRPISIVN